MPTPLDRRLRDTITACLLDLDVRIRDTEAGDCSPYEVAAVAQTIARFADLIDADHPFLISTVDDAVDRCNDLIERLA